MRSKMWYAALLAALILALGLVALPTGTASGNDDLELLQPPGGENGDPDSGGPSKYFTFGWSSWFSAPARSVSFLRISQNRREVPGRAVASTGSRRTTTARR